MTQFDRHRKGWDSLMTIWNSAQILTNEQKTGFTISELDEYTHGFGQRTVRDCVEFLQLHGAVQKRSDGRYYLINGPQPTEFDY